MDKKHSLWMASTMLFEPRNEEGFVITEDIKGHQRILFHQVYSREFMKRQFSIFEKYIFIISLAHYILHISLHRN